MDQEGALRVRRSIASLGRRGRTTRIPDSVRAEVGRFAREQRAQGVGWREIAEAIGLSRESLRRFTGARGARARRPRKRATLVPVAIRSAEPPAKLIVVAPGGYRVEGATVDEAAQLLRLLA